MLQSVSSRLVRVLRLDHTVFREIAADEQATSQAALVALLAAALSAFGGSPGEFLARLAVGFLVSWLLWATITRFLGSVLYQSATSVAPLARVLGYAVAPMALGVFGALDCLGFWPHLLGWALPVFYGFHAVRDVMDLRTEAAAVTVGVGALIVLAIRIAVQALL